MNWIHEKWWLIISALLFILLIFVATLTYRFNRQNEIIATELAVIKESARAPESVYKETYYLSQLDREMDRLILMITILFAIFGLISIVNFNSRIGYIGSQHEKWKIEQENNYKSLKHELIEFKIRFIKGLITERVTESQQEYLSQNKIIAIIHMFGAIGHYVEIINLENEIEDGEPDVWQERLKNRLKTTLMWFRNDVKIPFRGGEATNFTNALEQVRSLNDKEMEKSANELFNKMDFMPILGDVTPIKL